MQKGGCMRDYTHAIAIRVVDKMNEYRGYTESERIVITYRLELFLNNNLKRTCNVECRGCQYAGI